MEKDLTQLEIQTLYNRIVKDGVSELEGIKPFKIRQVYQYANKINMDAIRFCASQLDANQNYNYPPEYPADRQIEYWFNMFSDYGESKYVMDLLSGKFKEIKSIPKVNHNEIKSNLKEDTNKIEVKEPTNIFSYSNDEKYFYPEKINSFKEIENNMLDRDFFKYGKWNKEKKILVAFIYILQKLDYLKLKLKGKNNRTLMLAYRRFFENRYQTKISKEMQPSRFKVSELKRFEADFFFIPDIRKL